MNAHQTFSQEIATAALVVKALEDAGITPDDPDYATLIESECDAIERIRRILRAARCTEANSKALKEIEEENRERRKRFEAKAETLRAIALQGMKALQLPKVEAPDFTASVTATRPSVSIDDPEAIPSQLCRIKREPDKTAIKAALEQGEAVPGASLSSASQTLTVRTR
ncbi:siphovirus Gp157 family protein [Microvirga lotononidis]|uniref:Gp157-like protein n=1 Tax=Microvirga lotononidis TaxID=864069 RepID=I4YP15_9HYPH|nr:siphovirus Gp157 family protein [Microvirga lotononidis]EIM25707.1 Gp157-like protein [Microvirga lotononidis]WQO25643.1 siphovirus Gp157 family protein [Microvirga lotononidis]